MVDRRIDHVVVRHRGLRWPVREDIEQLLQGLHVRRLERRSKYLLIDCEAGWLILHLGMSGSLRLVAHTTPPGKHDHLDIVLDDGKCLRLTDPRRFGAVLWHEGEASKHQLLRALGPEPFSEAFDAHWLHQRTRGRQAAVKNVLMDAHVVVGVGNIYANESLFRAGIHPARPAAGIALRRYARLVDEVRATLREAIEAGGSSLRDFVHADGGCGYFQQQYFVYGRAGQACRRCGNLIKVTRIGQRSAFYCPRCQR